MSRPPSRPKIYHITHVSNLPAILADGHLLSDRAMIERGGPEQAIGMSAIKRRRVEELPVPCHPRTKVGDYVPFYFCPRSIMLYVISCRNHPQLAYRGGQDPILHLAADLHEVIRWADGTGVRWAFSLSNAGAYYAEFRASVDALRELNWASIAATDFAAPDLKEGKQAEFLLHERFPFELVERVAARSRAVADKATRALRGSSHKPAVSVRPQWYF